MISPVNRKRASRLERLAERLAFIKTWPFIVGVFLLMAGVILRLTLTTSTPEWRELFGVFVSELGFAGIIAAFLTLSVEEYAKTKHNREMTRSIIQYVYGSRIDSKLFESITNFVFTTKFYRRNLVVEYDFEDRIGEKILIRQTTSYEVENITRELYTYDISMFVEKADGAGSNSAFRSAGHNLGLVSIFVDGWPLSEEDLKKARAAKPDTHDEEISSHPIEIGSGNKRSVRTVHLIEKHARDQELWRSVAPCSGVRLALRWTSGVDLDVHVLPVHPQDRFDLCDRGARSLTCEISQPLFPHNGCIIWWDDKMTFASGAGSGQIASVGLRRSRRNRLTFWPLRIIFNRD